MSNPDRNQASAGAVSIPQVLQTAVNYHQNGQIEQAQALYQQVLRADPHQPDALQLMGLIEHQLGNSALAVELIQKAIKGRPHAAMYHFNLGNTLQDMGQLEQAIASFRRAIALQPNFPDASYNLGNALNAHGQLAEAIASYQQALLYNPGFAEAYLKIGKALLELNRLDEAIASFRRAISIKPNDAYVFRSLGNALESQGKHAEAVASYRQGLKIKPDDVDAYLDCARALVTQGQLNDAIDIFRKLLVLQPDCASTHSNLLLTLQSLSTCSSAELFDEHLRYADRFEAPLKPFWKPHTNSREPERRLKVGYVSADFFRHVVANFIEPILANHDKARFEIYGYYNNTKTDSYNKRIASQMNHFLACNTLSDDELAERIRADGIDILVDLSGHTALNRLLVFARKPAPVQASYIGYPGTTGLSAIDYRISDPWQDPVGLTERYHSETLVRIPGGMAFAPEPDASEVNALPALSSNEFMLACLNNLSKLNPAVVNLWARILHALPQARLMLGNVTDSGITDWLLGLFAQAGIGPERLLLQPRVSVPEYLVLHHKIDLALDPFPYNGGTTTMHSLWMGVPVITLAGDHAVSRLSAAHLSRVGLAEFITHSEDDYLQCAIRFANDLPALNQVRQSLRTRLNAPQCQPKTITRQLEAAYREMWRTWCKP